MTIQDLQSFSDHDRKYFLQHRLETMFKNRGKTINNEGIVNLVPLWRAAYSGDLATVKTRLEAGVNPNETGFYGSSIEGAAKNGHLEIIKLLVEHPLVNRKKIYHALYYAFINQHANVVYYLSTIIDIKLSKLLKVAEDKHDFVFEDFLTSKQDKFTRSSDTNVKLSQLSSLWKKYKCDQHSEITSFVKPISQMKI